MNGISLENLNIFSVGRSSVLLPRNISFSGSIYENLAFLQPNASKEDILEALKFADADKSIEQMSNGIDSDIGEFGNVLNERRQRNQIARTVLMRPDVYVFDETTSSIDTASENKIFKNIKSLSKMLLFSLLIITMCSVLRIQFTL